MAEDLAPRLGLRAADALHIATRLRHRYAHGGVLVLLTRDEEQAAAAGAEGLTVE